MGGYRVAFGFASALLLLGAGSGQQSVAETGSYRSPQPVISESQSSSCKPQAPTATNPFDTCKYLPYGPDIRRAKAVSTPAPAYPESARKAKLSGSVVLAVAINEKGQVDDVRVVRSSDRTFEQNSMDAARQFSFLPAMKNGKPVAIQMDVEMGFNLR